MNQSGIKQGLSASQIGNPVPRAVKTSITDVNNRASDVLGTARRLADIVTAIQERFYGGVNRVSDEPSKLTEDGALPQIDCTLAEALEILSQTADELNVLNRDLFGEELAAQTR